MKSNLLRGLDILSLSAAAGDSPVRRFLLGPSRCARCGRAFFLASSRCPECPGIYFRTVSRGPISLWAH
jgi:predicted Zn-ribbon and HTH transcriptional regulator